MTGRSRAIAGGVVLFAALSCADLLGAWRQSPYDLAGSIAFGSWVASLWLAARPRRLEQAGPSAGLLASSVLAVAAGTAGQVNALQHFGLALGAVGGLPFRPVLLLWVPAALAWLPALGWALGEALPPVAVGAIRLGLAALPWALTIRRKEGAAEVVKGGVCTAALLEGENP